MPPLERGIKGDLFARWGVFITRAAVLWDGATKYKQENLPYPLFSKEG
jgi:hypothetical protein